ncbi:MAG: hypothetical protein E7368_03360 [Clostridiales bacterium]|nr:hypothetical protein [Clostridiales bacterium]
MNKHFTIKNDFDTLELNIEEIFCAVPMLKDYFLRMHEEIENFEKLKWQKTITKQVLCLRIELILGLFSSLDIRDIRLLYYVKNSRGINYMQLLKRCESVFEKETQLYNDFLRGNERKSFNPFLPIFNPLED